jgi:hypothetical protein
MPSRYISEIFFLESFDFDHKKSLGSFEIPSVVDFPFLALNQRLASQSRVAVWTIYE